MDPRELIARHRQERHQIIAMYSETVTDLHATIAQQQSIIQTLQKQIADLTAKRESGGDA